MTTRQTACSLAKVSGCTGMVSKRGNTLCDNCIENRKTLTKLRKEQSIDELFMQNKELERELAHVREMYKTSTAELKTLQDTHEVDSQKQEQLLKELATLKSENHIADYNSELEKENNKLLDSLNKLRSEIETLVKEKAEYEVQYHQNCLDTQKTQGENERLQKAIAELKEQNELLQKEIDLNKTEEK